MGRVATTRKEKKDGCQRRRRGEERLKGFLRCDLLVSFPGLDRMSLLSSSGSGPGGRDVAGIRHAGRETNSISRCRGPGVVSREFETTVTHDSEINIDKEERGRGGGERKKKDKK